MKAKFRQQLIEYPAVQNLSLLHVSVRTQRIQVLSDLRHAPVCAPAVLRHSKENLPASFLCAHISVNDNISQQQNVPAVHVRETGADAAGPDMIPLAEQGSLRLLINHAPCPLEEVDGTFRELQDIQILQKSQIGASGRPGKGACLCAVLNHQLHQRLLTLRLWIADAQDLIHAPIEQERNGPGGFFLLGFHTLAFLCGNFPIHIQQPFHIPPGKDNVGNALAEPADQLQGPLELIGCLPAGHQ